MKNIGLIHDPEMDEATRKLIAEKRAAYEALDSKKNADAGTTAESTGAETLTFPAGSMMCDKCNTKALVLMDNCQTCLNCGYSKCG